jgi:hypothetical protein
MEHVDLDAHVRRGGTFRAAARMSDAILLEGQPCAR